MEVLFYSVVPIKDDLFSYYSRGHYILKEKDIDFKFEQDYNPIYFSKNSKILFKYDNSTFLNKKYMFINFIKLFELEDILYSNDLYLKELERTEFSFIFSGIQKYYNKHIYIIRMENNFSNSKLIINFIMTNDMTKKYLYVDFIRNIIKKYLFGLEQICEDKCNSIYSFFSTNYCKNSFNDVINDDFNKAFSFYYSHLVDKRRFLLGEDLLIDNNKKCYPNFYIKPSTLGLRIGLLFDSIKANILLQLLSLR